MSFKTYTEWLGQKRDIFGFEKEKAAKTRPTELSNEPFHRFNHEIIMKELAAHPMGMHKASWDGFNVVTWGDQDLPEALHLEISPLGSFKIIIRKLVKSLIGENVWICKKVTPLPDEEIRKNEMHMAERVIEELNGVDDVVDSPAQNYNLEILTLKLAEAIRKRRPVDVMYFDRIKKIHEHHYLITMNVKGMGVEAPGQSRIEQFHVHTYFDKNSGLIRSFGNDIASSTKVHSWIPQPSEWDENFAPTQPHQEIVDAIVSAFSTY